MTRFTQVSNNDTITIDGAGNKTVDGGTGTDSLAISYTGITGLTDFTASKDGDYVVFDGCGRKRDSIQEY